MWYDQTNKHKTTASSRIPLKARLFCLIVNNIDRLKTMQYTVSGMRRCSNLLVLLVVRDVLNDHVSYA